MVLEDLPQAMKDHIISVVGRRFPQSKYPVTVYLTDITGCIVKSYYRGLSEEERAFKECFHLWKGTVFDKDLTSVMPQNQKRVTHRIPDFDGSITGKWDFMEYEGGKRVVSDLKIKDDLKKVHKYGLSSEYKRQVLFYMYTESTDMARVYYLSLGDCIRFDVIPKKDTMTSTIQDLEERARLLLTARREGKPPVWKPGKDEARYMCGEWCDHYKTCYTEEVVDLPTEESTEPPEPAVPEETPTIPVVSNGPSIEPTEEKAPGGFDF